MKRLMILIALLTACAAKAQTLNMRAAMTKTGKPCYDFSIVAPKIEFYVFGANTNIPSYELGRLWPVHEGKKSLLQAGGYIAYWPNQGVFLAEPYLYGYLNLPAKLRLDGTLGLYAPIAKRGNVITYTDTISLTRRFGDLSVGPGFTFWLQSHEPCQVRPAAIARLKDWEIRWLPDVGSSPSEVRFKRSFNF